MLLLPSLGIFLRDVIFFLQDGKVMDSVWYIKEKHGEGVYTCHLGMDAEYEKSKVKGFYDLLAEYHRESKAKQRKEKYWNIPRMKVNRPFGNRPEKL